jgi:hypothetical protein
MKLPTAKYAEAPLLAPAASNPPLVTALGSRAYRRAANDDVAAEASDAHHNPLWIIVIGIACFFASVVAVMALG